MLTFHPLALTTPKAGMKAYCVSLMWIAVFQIPGRDQTSVPWAVSCSPDDTALLFLIFVAHIASIKIVQNVHELCGSCQLW